MFAESRTLFMPLGAGAEVGRSCMYVRHGDATLLLDIGVHPAHAGICGLPFLDLVDLSKVDACFVTHFHLDHAGALPYLTEKTTFKGAVYMTHPTRAILKYLLNDYARVVNAAAGTDFYTEEELQACYARIIPIDYDQEVCVRNVRITALNAGHVLGAAMFVINAQKKLLYTGDYSTETDRHLLPATPPGNIDILACEATYGTQCHLPRAQREQRFLQAIEAVIARRGRALLPVFALGRAQELLLILDEHWAAHPRLHNVPVLYCSALARRCIGVYQAHAASTTGCSFDLRHVSSVSDVRDPPAPCVVLASPGMLQTGLSRRLFERWCGDKRNGVILAGYAVQGTLAKDLLAAPTEVASLGGARLPVTCSVDAISFSAHVDFPQNSAFIRACDPAVLFLVHGEGSEMLRLATALRREHVYALRNGERAEVVCNEKVDINVPKQIAGPVPVQAAVVYDSDGLRAVGLDDLVPVTIVQVAKISEFSRIIDPYLNSEEFRHKAENFAEEVSDVDTTDSSSDSYVKEILSGTSDGNEINRVTSSDYHEVTQDIYKTRDPSESLVCSYVDFSAASAQQVELGIIVSESSRELKVVGNEHTHVSLHDRTESTNSMSSDSPTQSKQILFFDQNNENLNQGPQNEDQCQKPLDPSITCEQYPISKNVVPKDPNPQVCTSFVKLPFNAKLSLIKNILQDHFPTIKIQKHKLKLESITIYIQNNNILIRWETSYINDLLAQTVTHILQNLYSTKLMRLCDDGERETLVRMLKNRYSSVLEEGPNIHVNEGAMQATVIGGDCIGHEALVGEIREIMDTVSAIFGI